MRSVSERKTEATSNHCRGNAAIGGDGQAVVAHSPLDELDEGDEVVAVVVDLVCCERFVVSFGTFGTQHGRREAARVDGRFSQAVSLTEEAPRAGPKLVVRVDVPVRVVRNALRATRNTCSALAFTPPGTPNPVTRARAKTPGDAGCPAKLDLEFTHLDVVLVGHCRHDGRDLAALHQLAGELVDLRTRTTIPARRAPGRRGKW